MYVLSIPTKLNNCPEILIYRFVKIQRCQNLPFQTKEELRNLAYKENTVLPPESACCSTQDRTIEYKALRSCTLEKNDRNFIEKPLVDRLGKFLVACMNARVNGTISFGVIDSIEDERQSHGCVKGIHVPKDKRSIVIGIVDKHFSGNNPKQFQGASPQHLRALQLCLKPPVLIPVSRHKPDEKDYVVVEFDVHPTYEVCGASVFSIQISKPGGKKNEIERRFYLRQGASSCLWEERHYKELLGRVQSAARSRQVRVCKVI